VSRPISSRSTITSWPTTRFATSRVMAWERAASLVFAARVVIATPVRRFPHRRLLVSTVEFQQTTGFGHAQVGDGFDRRRPHQRAAPLLGPARVGEARQDLERLPYTESPDGAQQLCLYPFVLSCSSRRTRTVVEAASPPTPMVRAAAARTSTLSSFRDGIAGREISRPPASPAPPAPPRARTPNGAATAAPAAPRPGGPREPMNSAAAAAISGFRSASRPCSGSIARSPARRMAARYGVRKSTGVARNASITSGTDTAASAPTAATRDSRSPGGTRGSPSRVTMRCTIAGSVSARPPGRSPRAARAPGSWRAVGRVPRSLRPRSHVPLRTSAGASSISLSTAARCCSGATPGDSAATARLVSTSAGSRSSFSDTGGLSSALAAAGAGAAAAGRSRVVTADGASAASPWALRPPRSARAAPGARRPGEQAERHSEQCQHVVAA